MILPRIVPRMAALIVSQAAEMSKAIRNVCYLFMLFVRVEATSRRCYSMRLVGLTVFCGASVKQIDSYVADRLYQGV